MFTSDGVGQVAGLDCCEQRDLEGEDVSFGQNVISGQGAAECICMVLRSTEYGYGMQRAYLLRFARRAGVLVLVLVPGGSPRILSQQVRF